jgi:LysM repeat protein
MTYSTQARLDNLGLRHGVFEPKREGAFRWFSWLLVISLSVNVAVVAFLVFQMQDGVLWFEVETREPAIDVSKDTSRSDSLKGELIHLRSKSDEELIGALDDETTVANGYRRQELALAILHARGYQVEDPLRPLGAWPQPMSVFSWTSSEGKQSSCTLFSTIGPREIQAVHDFLRETAVPLTAEGIVRRMKEGNDLSLMREALLRTDEWTAFSRVFGTLSEEDRLLFSRDIGGEAFACIVEWACVHTDPTQVGPFVVSIFPKFPSAFLAEFVASHFADHVVLQAPDDTVVMLYTYLPTQCEAGVRLAMRLLHGQRKLPVWQASQSYLARAASMPTLSAMNRDQVLAWLQQMAHPEKITAALKPDLQPSAEVLKKPEVPTPRVTSPLPSPSPSQSPAVVSVKPATPASSISSRVATRQLKPYRTYVVRTGDTLWSIARRFNVDVEKLKYLNGLKGATLSPGKVLRIPH